MEEWYAIRRSVVKNMERKSVHQFCVQAAIDVDVLYNLYTCVYHDVCISFFTGVCVQKNMEVQG